MRTLDRERLGEYLADLPDLAHGALIYNDDSVRYPVLFGFLQAGLEKDWLCLYATVAGTPEPVRKRMQAFGLDPDHQQGSLLIRTGTSLFGLGEEPDWDQWISSLDAVFAEAGRLRKRGVRWAGELSNYFLRLGKLDRWFQMEQAFDERAPNYSTLCAYDSRITFDRSVADVVEHYQELPYERRRFSDLHSFSVFSLDAQTHQVVDNLPGGLHPGYSAYPRPVGPAG